MAESEIVFETERLYARPWRLDDAEGAFAMYGDPDVVRHIGNQLVPDVATQRERLAALIERRKLWGGRLDSWPMIEKATGELVGTSMLKPPTASGTGGAFSEDIEIGWHVAKKHWGRGFASEFARELLRLGFESRGLSLLHAVVESPNARSLAVARRIGMRHTGKTKLYYDTELEHFELSLDEWRARGG